MNLRPKQLAVCTSLALLFLSVAAPTARSAPPPVSSPRLGILYEPWQCLVKGRPIYDISEYLAGRQTPVFFGSALARSPSSIGGANQQLGNDELLRLHAIQLARAGIDFVAVDFSNHDSLSYEYVNIEYLEPLRHLLTV